MYLKASADWHPGCSMPGDRANRIQEDKPMTIRTQLKASRTPTFNHNETIQVRSSLKAGGRPDSMNHNEALQVRSSLKAAGKPDSMNHNETMMTLRVQTNVLAGAPETTPSRR